MSPPRLTLCRWCGAILESSSSILGHDQRHSLEMPLDCQMNLPKSSVTPVQCAEPDLQMVQATLPWEVNEFPCTYLGLPISTHKQRQPDWEDYRPATWMQGDANESIRHFVQVKEVPTSDPHLPDDCDGFATMGHSSNRQNQEGISMEGEQGS